ncbi:MAG: hypothetical protein OEL77_00350 [Nitrosopumilus sp.]|nr:hypothetical protein [Nitrosopumilus sp.]MDH3384453.1 hypothetical protein [Nitrosopumilus sp.]
MALMIINTEKVKSIVSSFEYEPQESIKVLFGLQLRAYMEIIF